MRKTEDARAAHKMRAPSKNAPIELLRTTSYVYRPFSFDPADREMDLVVVPRPVGPSRRVAKRAHGSHTLHTALHPA